ncbi:hypothetical protein V1499_11115 [Neobacillus sp. SCS-31]|uniref:hypothetical protein n=1 Tax=Neobacillus oceani TaxID=3115292 RepID=UPI003905F46D
MSNNFISYLNSMNNANSSNENAIAESQITNPYYDKIRVERNIGNYLIERIKEKPTTVLLTGHAGDGKTSLVYQMLRELRLIDGNEQLKVYDEYYSEEISSRLLYIKDMSELNKQEQVHLLKRSLDIKESGGSAVLISNTGPLIDSFKGLEEKYPTGISNTTVEMDLLRLMDENTGLVGKVGVYDVLLINMARIDNVVMVPKLFKNMLSDELWEPCNQCDKKQVCPMYNNYLSLNENYNNVEQFITSYYRWLYETDKRLTIRQILSQLSYSITGNLTCESIEESNSNESQLYIYHFSNLFFGYTGVSINTDAIQIKAIKELQSLGLDTKELKNDYNIFIKGDFEYLTPIARSVIEPIWQKRMRRFTTLSIDLLREDEPYQLRKSVRRMEILFGKHNEKTMSDLLGRLFSPIYPEFLNTRVTELTGRELRNIKSKVIKALYFMLVGIPIDSGADDVIYLPLNRKGKGIQSVQLLLGKIETSDIYIKQNFIESDYDSDENHFALELSFGRTSERFSISLMLLDYFDKVSKGAVSTKLNPSLSHGVDRMKSKLYHEYKFNENEPLIKVLVQTIKGPKLISFEIAGKELYVD